MSTQEVSPRLPEFPPAMPEMDGTGNNPGYRIQMKDGTTRMVKSKAEEMKARADENANVN